MIDNFYLLRITSQELQPFIPDIYMHFRINLTQFYINFSRHEHQI